MKSQCSTHTRGQTFSKISIGWNTNLFTYVVANTELNSESDILIINENGFQ